jgi:hypothetical protein
MRRKRLAKVITFGASVEDPKPQVTLTAETVRGMTLEASGQIDYPHARITGIRVTPERRCPISSRAPESLRRAHARAVAEGLQGCVCRVVA